MNPSWLTSGSTLPAYPQEPVSYNDAVVSAAEGTCQTRRSRLVRCDSDSSIYTFAANSNPPASTMHEGDLPTPNTDQSPELGYQKGFPNQNGDHINPIIQPANQHPPLPFYGDFHDSELQNGSRHQRGSQYGSRASAMPMPTRDGGTLVQVPLGAAACGPNPLVALAPLIGRESSNNSRQALACPERCGQISPTEDALRQHIKRRHLPVGKKVSYAWCKKCHQGGGPLVLFMGTASKRAVQAPHRHLRRPDNGRHHLQAAHGPKDGSSMDKAAIVKCLERVRVVRPWKDLDFFTTVPEGDEEAEDVFVVREFTSFGMGSKREGNMLQQPMVGGTRYEGGRG